MTFNLRRENSVCGIAVKLHMRGIRYSPVAAAVNNGITICDVKRS